MCCIFELCTLPCYLVPFYTVQEWLHGEWTVRERRYRQANELENSWVIDLTFMIAVLHSCSAEGSKCLIPCLGTWNLLWAATLHPVWTTTPVHLWPPPKLKASGQHCSPPQVQTSGNNTSSTQSQPGGWVLLSFLKSWFWSYFRYNIYLQHEKPGYSYACIPDFSSICSFLIICIVLCLDLNIIATNFSMSEECWGATLSRFLSINCV